jgi:GntR family transcriptional repressor for pyruvate dehydrogenase complex
MMTTVEQLDLAGKLGAVSRNTLAEQAVVILKRFILLERIPDGGKLPSERGLAAALGVSHRVVREALNIMQGEGLISKAHGRGSFVQRFDRDRLQAEISILPQSVPDPKTLLEARCAIESGNMYIVARNASADDLAQLQALVNRMKRKAERGESPSAEDQKFHLSLLRATHNPTLITFDYLIRDSMRLYVYNRPGLLHRSVQEESRAIRTHQTIIDALLRRDGAGAAEAMVDHLQRGIDQINLTV